jgi:alkyl hydroperoxide reductase subunit AhpC
MVDGEITQLSLDDFKGHFLVLFFYPLDFTFVCPTEIQAFNDRAEEFQQLGARVVGASTDSAFSHLAWWKTPRSEGGIEGVRIPLLADLTKQISADYGVLLEDQGVALRGLFVIDREGLVRHMLVNDLPVGRSVDEALRVVQAIQFTDEHGEVCPAGWSPGSKTITPEPERSKEYFRDPK